MASSSASSASNTGDVSVPLNSIAGLSIAIFTDFLRTITEDIVLEAHRSEKLIRMAAIQASMASSVSSPSVQDSGRDRDATGLSVLAAKQMGRALEVGFKEEICPQCLLPRHTAETFAAPPVPGKKWCAKLPIHEIPGCDVHGNPIVSSTAATKNNREKQTRNAELANDRISPFTDASSQTPPSHLNGAGKASAALPNVKCPNCEKDIIVSRFAAHLEKCLGINSRKSARATTARGNTTSGVGTPSFPSTSRRNSPAIALSPASSGPNVDENNVGGGSVPASQKDPPTGKITGNSEKKALSTKKKQSQKKDKLGLENAISAPKMEKSVSSQTLRATGSPTPPPNIQMPAPTASTQKKKKRKAEALDGDVDSHPKEKEKDKSAAGEKLSKKEKERDAAISSSKPQGKKQKTGTGTGHIQAKDGANAISSNGPLPALHTTSQAKSQLSKFKNRAGSPSLGSPSKKDKLGGVEMNRSQSDTSLALGQSDTQTNSSPPPMLQLGLKGSPTKTPTKLSTSMTQSSTKMSSKASSGSFGPGKILKDKKLDKDREKPMSEVSKEGRDGPHPAKKEKATKPKSSAAFTGSSTPKPSGITSGNKDGGTSVSPEKKKIHKSAAKLGNSPSGKVAPLPKNHHRSESPSSVNKISNSNSLAIGSNSNGKRERERDDGSSEVGLPRKKSKEDNESQS